jgi:hypothetical protein
MLHALLHSADDFFNADGAWWILALDGILLIPVVFAVFFFPMAMFIALGAAALLTIGVLVLMRVAHARHHP